MAPQDLQQHLQECAQTHLTMVSSFYEAKVRADEECFTSLQARTQLKENEIIQLRANVLEKEQEIAELKNERLTLFKQIQQTTRQLHCLQAELPSTGCDPESLFLDYAEWCKNRHAEWCSPPFYTHRVGYKFQFLVAKHLLQIRVRLRLMKGEYDDHLHWPFSGVIVIQLQGQEGTAKDKSFEFVFDFSPAPAIQLAQGERADPVNAQQHFEDSINLYIKDGYLRLRIRMA